MARERKPYRWQVDLAWGLILSPTLLLFPLAIGALADPRLVLRYWDFYLLFFGLPYAGAVAIFLLVRRARRSS